MTTWVLLALGAALSWGMYGPVLHKGQAQLASPLRALLCVGFAYFLVGVLVPLLTLRGSFEGFNTGGTVMATLAGILGALGAVCIIFAFRAGGAPTYVMPLVFSLAPVVNVLYSMMVHPPKQSPSPMLYLGFVLAAAGAYIVLRFKPQG
jgi:drug/metabolite transporter (DMT)-like permease